MLEVTPWRSLPEVVEAAALRLRTTATAVRLGTRAEGALHGERSYRCAKVVDERSMRDHQ